MQAGLRAHAGVTSCKHAYIWFYFHCGAAVCVFSPAAMEVPDAAELAQRQSRGEAAPLEEGAEAAAAEAKPAPEAAEAAAAVKAKKAVEALAKAGTRELLRYAAELQHSREWPTGNSVFIIVHQPGGQVELGESACAPACRSRWRSG